MAELTGVSWAHHQYSRWIGCSKVSPGCDHCYAENDWDKRFHRVEWGGERSLTKTENQPPIWDRKARAAGERRRVFCAAFSDVFDNQVPDEWRSDLWALIDRCRGLDWLLRNARRILPRCCPKAGRGRMSGLE